MVRTGKVAVGESVGVWGVGGVGTHIVQLARLVGAVPVIALDINPAVLDRALELGADYAFDSRDDQLRDKIAEVTDGRKLDVAFDAVGLKVTFEQALDCLTPGGRLVGVGMSAEAPTVGPTAMFGLTRKQVLGHLGYQNVDIADPGEVGFGWAPGYFAVDQRDRRTGRRCVGHREAGASGRQPDPHPGQALTRRRGQIATSIKSLRHDPARCAGVDASLSFAEIGRANRS